MSSTPVSVAKPRLVSAAFRARAFLRGSAVYLLGNVLNAAIPFALLPLLTRYLDPAQYGEVAMFQTVLTGLSSVVGLSVVGAAARKYYDGVDRAEMRDFIGTCIQLVLLSAGAVLTIVYAMRGPLSSWVGLETRWLLWSVLVTAALVVINLRLGQWQVRQEAGKFASLQVSQSAVNVALSLCFVVLLGWQASGRIAAQVAVAAIFMLASVWLLQRDGLLNVRARDVAHWREALSFGVPLIPHVAGLFLLNAVDRVVINDQLGLAAAGKYMVAVQLATVLALVMDASNKAYVPWLFERLKRDLPEEKAAIVRATYAGFAALLLCSVFGFTLGPWVVELVAGVAYKDAGEVIGWLVLAQAFNGMYLLVTNYIFFSKRTGLLSLTTISCGVLNVALLVALTHFVGLKGAAIATAMASAIRFVFTWRVAQLRHPMPWFGFNSTSAHAQ